MYARKGSRVRTRAVLLATGALVILAAGLTSLTLRWGLQYESALMHYAAFNMLAGAVPYRDAGGDYDIDWTARPPSKVCRTA